MAGETVALLFPKDTNFKDKFLKWTKNKKVFKKSPGNPVLVTSRLSGVQGVTFLEKVAGDTKLGVPLFELELQLDAGRAWKFLFLEKIEVLDFKKMFH